MLPQKTLINHLQIINIRPIHSRANRFKHLNKEPGGIWFIKHRIPKNKAEDVKAA
jgi:hypothetical protein